MFWKNSKKWKKRRLAIIQRNNNSCTRTFGQKLIMFSVVGSREETHDRILTHLLSPAVLFLKILLQRGGEENIDLIGLFYLNSHTVWLRLLFAHHRVSAHCWQVASCIVGFSETEQPCRKKCSIQYSAKGRHPNHTSNIWKIPLKCDSGHINGW